MRILGLDFGSKTIGVAVCDPFGWTAQGLEIIRREEENNLKKSIARISELCREYAVESIVLGLPKNMNNTEGERVEKTLAFKKRLEKELKLPVELWDERLSTVAAERSLLEADLSRAKRKKVIDNINLTLSNGVYGLLGENAAGKTTLMRLICGLLKESEGEITYNGVNIHYLGGAYREKLGYLPQDFGYYPNFTAEQFLFYLAELKAIPDQCVKSRVMELLEMVGLEEVKDEKLSSFSGGMLRRVGIAQALLNDSSILILDEPTSGLDPMERVKFRNIISSLSKEKIVLLSTHIVTDIEYIADEILLMDKGKIIMQGTIEDMTKPIKNKVWEYESSDDAVADIESKYIINSLKKNQNSTKLRIISSVQPAQKAICVEPTLEDAYLYYKNSRGV